jgi:N-[(2S)-2-amino-2-carboxyethyl]-L-glutamate dehydrogenase
MIYLNDRIIEKLNVSWDGNVQAIIDTIHCIGMNDTVQPIKPYLRYGDSKNRIIAMPAYVGGNINKAGIKWIASFPDNIQKGLARAHSVTILNEADTGIPVGVINSGLISAIRTASVSGFVMKKFVEQRKPAGLRIGIIGFGPIGQQHLNMCQALFGNRIDEVLLYDIRPIAEKSIPDNVRAKITIAEDWSQVYSNADVFITCTVSKERYIDKSPKAGALYLNVSLRDFKPDVFQWFANGIIVDSWEEVCRENTDIEVFHKQKGLQKSDVREIQDILESVFFTSLDKSQAIMFNPMGMAVFDIAMANHFIRLASEADVGVLPGESDLMIADNLASA